MLFIAIQNPEQPISVPLLPNSYGRGPASNVVLAEEDSPIPDLSRNNMTSEEEKKVCNDGSSKTVPKLMIKLKEDPQTKRIFKRQGGKNKRNQRYGKMRRQKAKGKK